MAQGTCSVCGSFGTIIRGWCWNHYQAWRAHGDPLINLRPELRMTPQERFWRYVDKDGPVSDRRPDLGRCWIWNGGHDEKNYGQFRLDGKTVSAHRMAYVWLTGPIADGLTIDHLCFVHPCVRPLHLEAVTVGENTGRGSAWDFQRRKTHCPQGHEYDETNTYVTREGWRQCRACRRLRSAQFEERKRSTSLTP